MLLREEGGRERSWSFNLRKEGGGEGTRGEEGRGREEGKGDESESTQPEG